MLVVLNDEIFNMDKADKIACTSIKNKDKTIYNISFFRDFGEYEYVSFKSKEERDKEWKRIKITINSWYV